MNYIFKKIDEEKYNDLLPLFKSAFNINTSIIDVSNKHETLFSGKKNLGFIAYSEQGNPVGFYGVYPALMVNKSKNQILIAQSGDTMVHKNHQKKGLFPTLAEKTYNLCKEENVSGLFGFPSATSYSGFVKHLGWTHNENIHKFEFFVPTLPIGELSIKSYVINRLQKTIINLVKSFFKEGSYFEGSITDYNQEGVYRTKEYWNYKMRNKSIFVLKICDADVIFKSEGRLGIGDIKYKDIEQLKNVLLRIKIFCLLTGFIRFAFFVSPGTKLDNDLKKIKKFKIGLPIIFKNFNKLNSLESLKFVYFDMDTF
jgi:hypothetical protein